MPRLRDIAAALCLLVSPALAQTPNTLPYQGTLRAADGAPLDGEVTLTFRLYDSPDGGEAIWEERIENVPVELGQFGTILGQVQPVMPALAGGVRYLGISVGDEAEAAPRQPVGSVPFALHTQNADQLRGVAGDQFLTVAQLDTRAQAAEAQVAALIAEAAGPMLSEAQVNALIDARAYLDGDAVDARIAAQPHLDEAALNALIDARGYISAADAAAAVLQAAANSQAQVDDLQNQIANLQTQIDALANAAPSGPYILGRSAQTSNGRISFNNVNGLSAATAMCRATFPNDPTAHLCTAGEVQTALSTGSWNPNNAFNNTPTWTSGPYSQGARGNTSLNHTCNTLMYNSGDTGDGTRLTVFLNYQSPGNGGGVTGPSYNVQQNIGCSQNMPVLCCR